ncbi:hypothetical protein SAMN02745218_00486 [Desulfofundulus australicus DSM 11792]|uniref:Uncharacterized protein n=1 Tax=Desulfofundulus australicus DSM 11792 TaxID=1121425 RepID=A0A1M4UDS4_9FIRM|nr:hypothetical protein SAMN02745218_00486 [Desulfofundulus australicus DSM 11792]
MLSGDRIPFLPEHPRPGPVQIPRPGSKAASEVGCHPLGRPGFPATYPPSPRGPHREPRWRWSRRGFLPTPRAHRFGRCHLPYRSGGSAPVPPPGGRSAPLGTQYVGSGETAPPPVPPIIPPPFGAAAPGSVCPGRRCLGEAPVVARAAALDPAAAPHSLVRGALRKKDFCLRPGPETSKFFGSARASARLLTSATGGGPRPPKNWRCSA